MSSSSPIFKDLAQCYIIGNAFLSTAVWTVYACVCKLTLIWNLDTIVSYYMKDSSQGYTLQKA